MRTSISKKAVLILAALLTLVAAQAATFAALSPVPPVADSSWHKIGDSDHVLVYSKEVPHSEVVAFRGETVINAPIAKVANVLIDTSRKKEWVFRIVEARDIRPIGEYERVEYNHTASGFFLVRDRDFVFHAKASLDREKGQMVVAMHSVEDQAVPAAGPVRGSIDEGRYILTKLSPESTHVVVEIHADPKGSVPKWLVNLFQKSWPSKTLNGIRNQCAKPDVLEHPGVKAFFAEGTKAASATKN